MIEWLEILIVLLVATSWMPQRDEIAILNKDDQCQTHAKLDFAVAQIPTLDCPLHIPGCK